MRKEELLKVLKVMSVRNKEIRDNVWFLKDANESWAVSLMYIFNYGYMKGVQAERAKKKVNRSL